MSRWLALFILVLSVVSARAACPLTGPQTVNSPYVVSGADPNCNFSFRQLGTNELTSPYPFSTSGSSTNFGFGQMVLALDNYNGFATGMVVQVTYQADPTQYIVGAIVAFDPTTGLATINAIVPNVSNIIAAGFNVQVLGGSPINGVPVWAGLGVDGTDTIANPAAAGVTVSLNIDKGKTFRQNSVVYCWAPQDITTWFLGTVISYNVATGAMSVFTTLTANTGLSYSTTFCSLIDTQGPAPALVGYSATQMATPGAIIFPTFLPGAFVGSSGSTVIAVGNNVTFTTQSGQFFPAGGQMLATCLNLTGFYFAAEVQSYSGASLVLKVTAIHNSGTCSAWSLDMNAALGALAPTIGFSTTSLTFGASAGQIAAGNVVTLTTGTGLLFNSGSHIVSSSTTDATQYFRGSVLSYNSSSGATTIYVTDVSGSGTIASWSLFAQDGPSIVSPLQAVSSTSINLGSIGGGTSLTVSISFKAGTWGGTPEPLAIFVEASNHNNWITGQFTSLTNFKVFSFNGTGTHTDWQVYMLTTPLGLFYPVDIELSQNSYIGNFSTATALYNGVLPTALWSGTVTPTALGINVSAVNTSTGLITFASNTTLFNGESVILTGAVANGFTTGTGYYLCKQTATTFFFYNTTISDALTCGSTGKVIPTNTTTGWSLRTLTLTSSFKQGMSSQQAIGATPGTTTMQFDLNLSNTLLTTGGSVRTDLYNLFDTTGSAGVPWLVAPNYTFASTVLVQVPSGSMRNTADNDGPGTWAQQSTNPFNISIWIWGALDEPIAANDNDLIERMAA